MRLPAWRYVMAAIIGHVQGRADERAAARPAITRPTYAIVACRLMSQQSPRVFLACLNDLVFAWPFPFRPSVLFITALCFRVANHAKRHFHAAFFDSAALTGFCHVFHCRKAPDIILALHSQNLSKVEFLFTAYY